MSTICFIQNRFIMRKLLPILVFAALIASCKEDRSGATEVRTSPTTTATESPSQPKPTEHNAPVQQKPVQSTESNTEVAVTNETASEIKKTTTVKVKQSSSNTSSIRVSEPVVSADVHNNSMAVSIPKVPERLMENYPFNVDLKTIDGDIVNSSEVLRKNGKPTVVLFWLSTCRPCQMKMDAIKPLYREWQEEADFNVVAISGDYPQNYPRFVKHVSSKGWEWDTYNDVNRRFKEILPGGLNGYPQTFIFDKNGNLVYQDKTFTPGDELALFYEIKRVAPAS